MSKKPTEALLMLELVVLAIFSLALLICVITEWSILYALVFGFVLFFSYGLYKKHGAKAILSMAFSGVKTVKSILVTFILIGMITAIWRAGGTIAYIVYHATAVCRPHTMVLLCFLLCCLVSVLTGTSFGTSATMGVICATMASSMGVPVILTGGAILAGAFFGDRCSPMSTSALLVGTLTKTDIFGNIKGMIKTSIVPFAVSCVLYYLAGLFSGAGAGSGEIRTIFHDSFVMSPLTLIPAAAIVVLSLFKVNVKLTMGVSILTGAAVTAIVQKTGLWDIVKIAVLGFYPEKAELARIISGGGIISMAKVFAIICLSSSFAGIFNGTGFLDGVKAVLRRVSEKITPFGGILLTSALTSMIACNQTLAIMLTHQICRDVEPDGRKMALDLENTAVVISALVPWSIASGVPLTTVGAPLVCVVTACYLYLVPLWHLIINFRKRK